MRINETNATHEVYSNSFNILQLHLD